MDVGVNVIYSTVELANGNDVDETDFIFDYEIMKNLNLHVVHAEFDGIDKNYESRIKLSYKLSLRTKYKFLSDVLVVLNALPAIVAVSSSPVVTATPSQSVTK